MTVKSTYMYTYIHDVNLSTNGWSFTYDTITKSIVSTGPRDDPTAIVHLFCHPA